MGDVFHYLELRAQGRTKEHRFRSSWKAVLYMLEDAAAIPSHNQPCEFSGEPRATFLMDFSPSKLRVASTHGDHTVRVSDVRTGKCTHILTGHPRTPWCLAFSPTSDDILASGCLAGEIRIWDLMGGGSEVLRNPRRGQVVTSLAFHPSGQVLAFATMNFIYFWDWSKETPFAFTQTSHESERIRWLKFDPYGHYLYTGIGNLTSFHRDIIGAELEVSDGLDDSAQIEERRNQQTLNRARYQRLLERFMAFQRERHRYRNESFLRRRNEYNPSNNPNRAGQRTQISTAETDDQSSLLGNTLNQSFPSQTAESEAFSWEDNRYGRRSLDSIRLGELSARQRWGRYEPSFFSRSNDSSSASSTDSSNSFNYSNDCDNSYRSGSSGNAASRINVRQDGQSSGPYPRTNLFPTGFEESAGAPSSLSHLSLRHASRSENVAASDGLDADEFKILPVDQGRESRYSSSRSRSMPSESLGCNGSGHRPDLLQQQRDEYRALLNKYVNRSSEGSSASSGASTQSSVAPSLTAAQSFMSSAASTADCVEANVRSFSVPPLAEAAQAVPLSAQYSRGAHLSTAASCSSNDLTSSDSQGSFEIQLPNAVSTSEHVFCRQENTTSTTNISEDHNLHSTNNHLSTAMSDSSEDINPALRHASGPLKRYTYEDYNSPSSCSRSASTTVHNHSLLRHPCNTRGEDISRHNSLLAPAESAPSAAVSPEDSSSSLMRHHRTSLKMAGTPKHNNPPSGQNMFSWASRHEANNSNSGHLEKPQRRSQLLFTDTPSGSQETTCRPIENNPLCKRAAVPRKIVRSDQSSASIRFVDFSPRNAQSVHPRYNEGTPGGTDSSFYSNPQQRASDIRPRCTNPLLNSFEATSMGAHKPEYSFPHLRLPSSNRMDNLEQNSLRARSVDSPAIRTRRLVMPKDTERVQGSERAIIPNHDTSFMRTHRPGHRYPFLRHETVPRTQGSIPQSGVHVPFSFGQSQPLRSPRLTYRNHPWGPYEGLDFRHHLSAFNDRQIPRPVTDQTSQTLGAMNLPASNDQGTDVVGLDTSANLVQTGSSIESQLDSLAPCIDFSDDTDQRCAFSSKNSHHDTSVILSSLLERDRVDGSAAQVSRSFLESERFQRIQYIVRSVRAYLQEEYGENFIQGEVHDRTTEPRNVADSQGNSASGIGERHQGSRFPDRHLRNAHFSNHVSRSSTERMTEDDIWESVEQANNNNTAAPWSPDISLSTTVSSSTFVDSINSPALTTDCPISGTSAFHGISSHANIVPSVYASDPVFSIPASSASRAIQLLSSAGSGPPESDRSHNTNTTSSNSSSLLSNLSYRPLLSGTGHETSARFHPYASALRRSRIPFRHRQQTSTDLTNNYSPVSETATRASDLVSSMSAGSSDRDSFEESQLHNNEEPLSQPACVASRLRHSSDSDQPSAFSIFSNANREAGRHPSQFRMSSSLFNAASANSDSTSSAHQPPLGVQSQPTPQNCSPTIPAPNSGHDHIPDFENENLHESSGAIGDVQQDSERNVTWRTPSLSLVNQVAVTEYLERRVIELDRRLSDLEHNYNSRLRELQVECQLRRTAHLVPGGHPTRLRGVDIGPLHDSRDSILFPRTEAPAQASRIEGAQPVPFRQLIECLRRQDPNPQARVSEADLPTSVTISQARDEESSEDTNGAGSSVRRRRPWQSLRQIHLHPDYSNTNILDDTINRRNGPDGSNIGGPYSNPQYDLGITSNLVVQTHRIQQWDITQVTVPNVSDASANIVVRHCKLHNDASCNLAQDGTLLVTIVPSHRRFSDSNIVALFSLRRQSFGQCLYTKSFGPDALSVSISPLNRYVLVGLATRRTIFVTPAQMVGQVFQLVKEKAGESSMKHHKDIYHIYDEDRGNHVSMNSARWLPGVGEGLVYGTNRGDLHFFRAGSRKVYDKEASCDREDFAASRRRATARSSIGTQTTTVSIRRSASTQTLSGEQVGEVRVNTEHEDGISDRS